MCFDQRNSWSPQNQPRQGRRRNRRWRKGCCIGREHRCSAKHSPFQHLCHNSVQPLKKILFMSFARRIKIIPICRTAHLKQFVLLNHLAIWIIWSIWVVVQLNSILKPKWKDTGLSTIDQEITKSTVVIGLIAAALGVHPTNNADEISNERWDSALEQHVVAQQNVLSADCSVIFLDDRWKKLFHKIF